MRTSIIILTITLLTFGCSDKDNSKGSVNDTLQISQVDTSRSNLDVMNSNVQYIGFIDKFYFSNDNEVYVELYFIKDEIDADEYKELVKLADSLIYQDDEISRNKFPDKLSQKYFDLKGLSKLKIYDEKNNFVCNADFLRVEHLDQNISSPFIAVYNTEKKITADSFYGVSNFNGTFEEQNYIISKDTVMTQNILKHLNEKKPHYEHENNGTHMHFLDNDTIVSLINSENYAYIVLTAKSGSEVLYKSSEFENIINLIVIPMPGHNLPHILTRNVQPETDVIWDNLLVFNGTKYEAKSRQRKE